MNASPSPDHDAILSEFCAITNHPHPADAVKLLETCGWNLERATGLYYDDVGSSSAVPPPQPRTIPESPSQPTQTPLAFTSWVLQQLRDFGDRVTSLSTSLYSVLRLFCLSLADAAFSLTSAKPFNVAFHETYGPLGPTFTSLPLFEAYREIQRHHKVLLLYLEPSASDRSAEFVKNVLQNQTLMDLIQSNDVVVWGDLASSFDAAFLMRQRLLICRSYPHLAFVVAMPDNSQNALNSIQWRLIGSVEGSSARATQAIELMVQALDAVRANIEGVAAKAEEASERRRLREEQDRAYLTAKQKDLEMKDQLRKQQQQHEEEKRKKQLEIQTLKDHQEKKKSEARSYIATYFTQHPVASANETMRVRFPTGEFLDQAFNPMTTSLSDVFAWIDVVRCIQEITAEEPTQEEKLSLIQKICGDVCDMSSVEKFCRPFFSLTYQIPENYTLVPSFEITQMFTRDASQCLQTLQELNFTTQSLLFLRPRVSQSSEH